MAEDPGALDYPRRTPLRRTLEGLGATWRGIGDAALAERIGPAEADGPVLVDLSPLPRLGFKGRGTVEAMRRRGVAVEAASEGVAANRVVAQPDGGLCLVLAPGEVLLLAPLDGDGGRLAALEAEWRLEDEERTYPVPRRDSHAWFALAGDAVPEALATLCGVDMRLHVFADGAIAQTSLARINAIVARVDRGGTPIFHILADSAAAQYVWTCLAEALLLLGGRVAGASVLRVANHGETSGQRTTRPPSVPAP